MTDTAESLDPLRLPLIGERLIEASAGTGKTFTIAALYLRLLLGLGGEAAYPRAISVEELLVVTFTEAATEELRGRIRSNIHGCASPACAANPTIRSTARCWRRSPIKMTLRRRCCWLNGRWTRRRYSPSTAFANGC